MKKFKKKYLFIILGIIIVLASIFTVLFFTIDRDKSSDIVNDNKLSTGKVEKLDISTSNPLDSVKDNIVRIINDLGEDKIIGSGFFIEDGYLVTNSHVVDIKGDISIKYSNGDSSKATLVSNDITSDVALLIVDDIKALAMNFGNTLNVKVTDDLYAVGYAVNLSGDASVTKGILSARRSIAGTEYLQTDAAINSGFSGGPLLNSKGEVVGINSLANENATIGMAISSESLQNIIYKLKDNKKVTYLDSDRPSNALSSVLKEVGYEYDDLYDEWKYFHKGEQKPVEKEEPKKETYKPSHVSELSYLGVKGYDIEWGNPGHTTKFPLYLIHDEDSVELIIKPKDSKATYKVKNDKNIPYGDSMIYITVTAEDGIHKTEYYISTHKAKSTIDDLKKITTSCGTGKNYNTNVKELSLSWSYMDSDDMYINGTFNALNNIKLDLYVCNNGTSCENDSDITLLKNYNFSIKVTDYNVAIPLSEVKSLLSNGNYFIDGSAEVKLKASYITKNQGTFYGECKSVINE